MIAFLRVLSAAVCMFITYVVTVTSLKSNLFEVGGELLDIPWMVATLWDFYANTLFLCLWMYYKEPTWPRRLGWTLLFCGLGSIAVSLYVFLKLCALKSGDPLDRLFLREVADAEPTQ